jgi:twitching motility protein PilJ
MAKRSADILDKQGADKPLILLVGLTVAAIMAMAAVFAYITIQSGYDKEYISLVGEQRVLSQRLTTYAVAGTTGDTQALSRLKQTRDRFQQALSTLAGGDPGRGLPPAPPQVGEELAQTVATWDKVQRNIDRILSQGNVLLALPELVQAIDAVTPSLLKACDDLVQVMVENGAEARQVALAARPLMLGERMARNLSEVMRGQQGAAEATTFIGRDIALFGRVMDTLQHGDPQRQIAASTKPAIQAQLQEVMGLYARFSDAIGQVLDKSGQLFDAQEAGRNVLTLSEGLLEDVGRLADAFAVLDAERIVSSRLGYALGALVLVQLVALGYKLVRDAQLRFQAVLEQNRRNQQAILRLLDEISGLAEGDLTAHATVTEDITGAIADAINYAIDSLRRLVNTINETSAEVSASAQNTQATALHLAEASNAQAEQIIGVSAAINEMVISIEQVSQHARESDRVAHRSVDTAKKGSVTVRDMISAMDAIREQIQETSKRIKRLGESSQQIGDIVELIQDIADQTNILALNAAIQAAMAGEAGRGFTVVADEVQRLAERVSNSTKQIEALVKTIQADTNEAVLSMERSTTGVVQGTALARNAGGALEEIDGVSNELAGLIENISGASQQQAMTASNISETMNVIQEIATETSTGSNEAEASIGQLVELANELRRSVAGFRLPQGAA